MRKLNLLLFAFLLCLYTSAQELDSFWLDNKVHVGKIYKIRYDTIKVKTDNGKYQIPANDMEKIIFGEKLHKKYGFQVITCENVRKACIAGREQAEEVKVANFIGPIVPTVIAGFVGGGISLAFDKYPYNYKKIKNSRTFKTYQDNFFYHNCFRDQVQNYRLQAAGFTYLGRLGMQALLYLLFSL